MESDHKSTQNVQSEWMTIDDLAAMLKLSKSTIYKMTSKAVLPHYKPAGKLVYFKRTEIEQWINESKVIAA